MKIDESTVDEALRLEDIESLFQHGAPGDEYSHEARTIASEINLIGEGGLTEERLAEVIRAVWNRSFGPFSNDEIHARMSAFRQVAHRIIIQRTQDR
jgi:hypothetical protein